MFSDYFKAWSNAVLATQVVTARLPILYMLAVDPTPSRQKEAQLMFAEKQEALFEGLVAAQHIACQNMADMMFSRQPGPSAFTDYMNALTSPAERILKANAKRLGK
ncbi:hypothetical protein FF098_016170 [Parvularcula flava]|uniref:Uncharacterized protein n=1 Tax=Aquisalinus luteolus TaxID=1566827 RepID=A0A8J3ES95_9PROT|nr:hypothetical protein [Aquisalinus luteolus]NHK29449.1 hypothetical protein [Aquisalinus luteolus]GGI01913.1 hypothetical protein GCM10011355_33670 [Aquisalinus luteolus]